MENDHNVDRTLAAHSDQPATFWRMADTAVCRKDAELGASHAIESMVPLERCLPRRNDKGLLAIEDRVQDYITAKPATLLHRVGWIAEQTELHGKFDVATSKAWED